MSEEAAPTIESDATPEFAPITSQEALDQILGKRIGRLKAQFADYDDLKVKAGRFDELQESQKSELQKMQDKITATEAELHTERRNALRAEVAAAKGVPPSRIHGETREELEADADELAVLLKKQDRPKTPSSGLKSGATGTDSRLDPKDRAAAALRTFRST